MPQNPIKMRIVNSFDDYWFPHKEEENFYNHALIRILRKKFDVVWSSEPDYILYNNYVTDRILSCLDYDCVRILYGIENIRADFNSVDYAIDCDFIDYQDRHLRLPFFAFVSFHKGSAMVDYDFSKRKFNKREKFCAFITSNGGNIHTKMRDDFFEKLSSYKRVDSGGKYKNNIGGSIDEQYAHN